MHVWSKHRPRRNPSQLKITCGSCRIWHPRIKSPWRKLWIHRRGTTPICRLHCKIRLLVICSSFPLLMTVRSRRRSGTLFTSELIKHMLVLREVYFSNNMLTVCFGLEAGLLPPLTFHTPISGFFWFDHPWRSTIINTIFLSCGCGLI